MWTMKLPVDQLNSWEACLLVLRSEVINFVVYIDKIYENNFFKIYYKLNTLWDVLGRELYSVSTIKYYSTK